MKKAKAKRAKKKQNLDDMENLSFTEVEAEEISSKEIEKDNFCDGDFDDKNVISRVKLF